MSQFPKRRVAILISGRGSNMQALVRAASASDYPAEIAVVMSNRPDAAGLAWAREQSIPVCAVDHKEFSSRTAFEAALGRALEAEAVDLIALAGFMRILSADFVAHWHGRMINVHPSLLPAFKGLDTHARVLESGVKITGCSTHFVTSEMDDGPIIAQAAVPVCTEDTPDRLAARVLEAEHHIYPLSLAWVASGEVAFNTAVGAKHGTVALNQRMIVPSGRD